MAIIMFTVECQEHGKMEVSVERPGSECPKKCFCPTKNGTCGKPLKRIWDVPNVHFHGEGFTQTSIK
jgi:hypothetical protein